jgi:hypothetical protein
MAEYLYWARNSGCVEPGVIDLGLDSSDPNQIVRGMTSFNGKLYVFTADRVIEVKQKSKWRLLREKVVDKVMRWLY